MEFIDEMFERLLAQERKGFGEAFEAIIKERAVIIRDLARIENGFQLFRKKYPKIPENYFREYIERTRPKDFAKLVHCKLWK